MSGQILVIGAMNADILGISDGPFAPGDSNIGRVRVSAGGVGRNIAAHLARQGERVTLLAPGVGGPWGPFLRDSLQALGIGLVSPESEEQESCIYLALHGPDGDMVAAVNDMGPAERLKPQAVLKALAALPAPSVCVLDANLPAPVLLAASRALRAPLVADPVSNAKALRLLPLLPRLAAVKPNRAEAEAMTGEADPKTAARRLLREGAARVFVSLGREGILYASKEEEGLLPAPPLPAACATGAGDAATAGIALGLLRGLDLRGCAQLGLRLAEEHLLSGIIHDRGNKP